MNGGHDIAGIVANKRIVNMAHSILRRIGFCDGKRHLKNGPIDFKLPHIAHSLKKIIRKLPKTQKFLATPLVQSKPRQCLFISLSCFFYSTCIDIHINVYVYACAVKKRRKEREKKTLTWFWLENLF
jgi:hypothetical protein